MAPRTTRSSSMKQATLGFSSTKRASSLKTDLKGKKSASATPVTPAPSKPKSLKRRASSLQEYSSEPTTDATSSDVSVVSTPEPAFKKPRAMVKSKKVDDDDVVILVDDSTPELHGYGLDDKDKRWTRVVRDAKKISGVDEPIHQGEQSKLQQMLRVFDMSYQYGPCIGITRLQRWERAKVLGLNPPPEIYDILTTKEAHGRKDYHLNVLDMLVEV